MESVFSHIRTVREYGPISQFRPYSNKRSIFSFPLSFMTKKGKEKRTLDGRGYGRANLGMTFNALRIQHYSNSMRLWPHYHKLKAILFTAEVYYPFPDV